MQAGVGLLVLNVMPIYTIIALNIVITMHFSINWPTVIFSPTICYVLEREASSENYAPRVYLNNIIKTKFFAAILFLLFWFAIYPFSYTRFDPCK